eukprot:1149961-Pelagomonas_calceolata.AAC.1
MSLPHQRVRTSSLEGRKIGLVVFWQHATPGHQSYVECFCFQWHVWFSCLAGAASYSFIASHTADYPMQGGSTPVFIHFLKQFRLALFADTDPIPYLAFNGGKILVLGCFTSA